ncbi:MAG TPA: hypothetical protein VIX35_13245, partial [Vicinamibacterales bacterium]
LTSMRVCVGWVTAATVFAAVAAAGLGAASEGGRTTPAARAANQGTIYAAVADAKGEPVLGLTAQDFAVRVAGNARPVTSAQAASDPLAIVLVVDGLGIARLEQVRLTLRSVVDMVARSEPQAQIGIENPPNALIMRTAATAAADLARDAQGYSPDPDAGPLVERLPGIATTLAKEPTRRRVILALTAPTTDGGRHAPADLVEAVRRTNCQVWNIEVETHADLSPEAAAARLTDLDNVLIDLAAKSGGRRDLAYGPALLDTVAQQTTRLLLSQYVLTYERDETSPSTPLRVGVRTAIRGVQVLAPGWIGNQ